MAAIAIPSFYYSSLPVPGCSMHHLAPNPISSYGHPNRRVLSWVEGQCSVLNTGGHSPMTAPEYPVPYEHEAPSMENTTTCVCRSSLYLQGCQKPYQNILGSLQNPIYAFPPKVFPNPLAPSFRPTQILKRPAPLPLVQPLPYRPKKSKPSFPLPDTPPAEPLPDRQLEPVSAKVMREIGRVWDIEMENVHIQDGDRIEQARIQERAEMENPYELPDTPPPSLKVNFHGPNWESGELKRARQTQELVVSPKSIPVPTIRQLQGYGHSTATPPSSPPNLANLRISGKSLYTSPTNSISAIDSSRTFRESLCKERREQRIRHRLLPPLNTDIASSWDKKREKARRETRWRQKQIGDIRGDYWATRHREQAEQALQALQVLQAEQLPPRKESWEDFLDSRDKWR